MEPSLSIEWTLESPGRLRVVGALDKNGGGQFARAVSEALLSDVRLVVLDLTAVDALDRDGLRLLLQVGANRRCRCDVRSGRRSTTLGAPAGTPLVADREAGGATGVTPGRAVE